MAPLEKQVELKIPFGDKIGMTDTQTDRQRDGKGPWKVPAQVSQGIIWSWACLPMPRCPISVSPSVKWGKNTEHLEVGKRVRGPADDDG